MRVVEYISAQKENSHVEYPDDTVHSSEKSGVPKQFLPPWRHMFDVHCTFGFKNTIAQLDSLEVLSSRS